MGWYKRPSNAARGFLYLTTLFATFLATLLFFSSNSQAQDSWSRRPRVLQPKVGAALSGLSSVQRQKFEAGKQGFISIALPGEGPLLNQNPNCAHCHGHSGTLGGNGPHTVTRFGRLTNGVFDPLETLGGSLLQSMGRNGCLEVIPPEANVTALRRTLPLYGVGLIEAIRDVDLIALSQITDPEISGRTNMVVPVELPGASRVGRFGWKAQVATIRTFTADAALNEMGYTSTLFPIENAPNGRTDLLRTCDTVPDPELPDTELAKIDNFQRYLSPPPQTPRSGMRGEGIFKQIGCAKCHTPSFTTPAFPGDAPPLEPELQGRELKPYSDFLVHDMGDPAQGGLGDNIVQGGAGRFEMRTTPLWGLINKINNAYNTTFHDNSQRSLFPYFMTAAELQTAVDQTVARHDATGSEARGASQRYNALPPADKTLIKNFLLSLGRPEFDSNFDDVVDSLDLHAFALCLGRSKVKADDSCAIFDFDQNETINQNDFGPFYTVYSGPKTDCNCNNQPDPLEIVFQPSIDANRNGTIDSCPSPAPACSCPQGDSDGDGTSNCFDGCPQDPQKTKTGRCGCGFPDTDTDSDGVADCLDICPSLALIATGPFPTSSSCQSCSQLAAGDSDSDGVPDCFDGCPNNAQLIKPGVCGSCSNASAPDVDQDGTPDCVDGCPNSSFKTAPGICGCSRDDYDSDNDGVMDCVDLCPMSSIKSSPGTCGCNTVDGRCFPGACGPEPDSDQDSVPDCIDGCRFDRLKSAPGQCGCDSPDTDFDGDGTANCRDTCPYDPQKTVPGVCGCDTPDVDSDHDSRFDCNDACPSDPAKTAAGVCGCGQADTDTDHDGRADCLDGCPNDPAKTAAGPCGCGTPDTDSDSDGTANCRDNCPNDRLKVNPGVCGCGVSEVNSDQDNTPDCRDFCPTDSAKIYPGMCGCGQAESSCHPPVLSNLTPAVGTTLTRPASICASAVATDVDGPISTVFFTVDGQPSYGTFSGGRWRAPCVNYPNVANAPASLNITISASAQDPLGLWSVLSFSNVVVVKPATPVSSPTPAGK